MLGRSPSAICIVLYYHSIAAAHRASFAKQMDLVARLTKPISTAQVPMLLPGRRYCAITFDDGFEDAVENAVPELVKRKLPATFFMTADVLGQAAGWWPESDPERTRRIATAEQVQRLPSKWITVGAHTMTHPRLSTLNEKDARREILEPRRRLESLLGRTIDSFSFPYGDFNESLVRWCRESGYRRVFTTQHKKAFEHPEEFVVGRVKVEPTDWALEFRFKLLGGYLWVPRAVAFKRRLVTSRIVNRHGCPGKP
jgi:peptidoglycan/xylan/chitin deacetylase (PgdA/CDA1 family)